MLNVYSVSDLGISLTTNQSVAFNVDSTDTCCRIDFTAGSSVIGIDKPGYYLVHFNSTGYNTGEASTVDSSDGTYSFQLYNNGIAVPNAKARATSTSDAVIANVSFETIIEVKRSCCMVNNNASLTVNYLGQAGTLLDATLTIVKLS